MTTATRPAPGMSRPPMNGTPPARPRLGRIAAAKIGAERIILNAVEGFGKTTFGAYSPNPAIMMARGETGYTTLRKAGRAPDADSVELISWPHVLETVDEIANSANNYGAVVLDALGGYERLCHEFVCSRDYSGVWGSKGFDSYKEGYDVSVSEWLLLLQRLDRVCAVKGIPIVLLSHCKIKNFKNPLGPDFDRYIADCHEKTWAATHKWADAVLFGTFQTVAVEDKKTKRAKGIGGDERVIFTCRRDGYDAKNRYGLPTQIDIPNDPTLVWPTVWNLIAGETKADDEVPV